jgi:hypothetical protein
VAMFLCRLVFKRQTIAAVASFGFGSFKTTSFRSNCVPCDNPNKDDDEDWKYKGNLPFHDDEDSDNQPTKRKSLELPLLLRKPKGTFGRKHVNKRARREGDEHENKLYLKFVKNFCGNSEDEAEKVVDSFKKANVPGGNQGVADGIILSVIVRGGVEDLIRSVFKVGGGRIKRVREGKCKDTAPGINGNQVTEDMTNQLQRLVFEVPTEEGYPCGHRELQIYLIDPEVTGWRKFYDKFYIPFENEFDIRKMGYSTLCNYMKVLKFVFDL